MLVVWLFNRTCSLPNSRRVILNRTSLLFPLFDIHSWQSSFIRQSFNRWRRWLSEFRNRNRGWKRWIGLLLTEHTHIVVYFGISILSLVYARYGTETFWKSTLQYRLIRIIITIRLWCSFILYNIFSDNIIIIIIG